MASVFYVVKNISPGKQTWRLKVRVERVWEMFPLDEPAKPFSVEMVLMDSKPMMKKFKGVIMEGEVYKMYFFGVVRNMGSFRATRHEYKLLFHSRTKASRCDAASIPFIGLDPFSSKQIRETGGESDFLLDFVGVLTAVSDENLFEMDEPLGLSRWSLLMKNVLRLHPLVWLRSEALFTAKMHCLRWIKHRHIRIPSWFARRWGEFMAADVILQDPARNRLRMHLMTFTMVSSHLFKIRIYGPDSVEIQYPRSGGP
ncbi:Nucleic acid-binding, OB-fold [Sesbania bispinosa]|nr:Nucleic acid-binding, OB-fold [Sesbania bispinosa]